MPPPAPASAARFSGKFSSANDGACRLMGRKAMAKPCACEKTFTRKRCGPSSTSGATQGKSTLPVRSSVCRRLGVQESRIDEGAQLRLANGRRRGRRKAIGRADPKRLAGGNDDIGNLVTSGAGNGPGQASRQRRARGIVGDLRLGERSGGSAGGTGETSRLRHRDLRRGQRRRGAPLPLGTSAAQLE
jgi:hypothetical protein